MTRIFIFIRPYRTLAVLSILLVIGSGITELAAPLLVQRLIDQGILPQSMSVILRTSGLMLALAAADAVLGLGNTMAAVRVSQHASADLRSALYRKVQTLSFGNLDRLQTGRLMVRLTSDVHAIQMVTLMSLRMLTRAPFMMVGSLALLIRTSPELARIMGVLIPATAAFIIYFAGKGRPLFTEVQRRLDRLNTVLQENLAGVRVVKAFVRSQHEIDRFAVANQDLAAQMIAVTRLFSVIMPTLFLFINLGSAAVLWLGGPRIPSGDLSEGQVVAFLNLLMSTMFPLMMLGMLIGQISAAGASVDRVFEVLDSEPDVQDHPGARRLENVQGRVVYENVSFAYNHDSSEPVLRNIHFTAEPGEMVAILGATGSGKSTLVNLLPRFYEPTEGRILIDGVDTREVTLESLRAQMGIALQESVLFSGTIRDNIHYGRPDASDEEVVAAARAAQAEEFILTLPEGYDTYIGERGAGLSGGQRQRLAIARALLVQPRILILDDSTSAVDVDTEARLQEALRRLMVGRTSLIIAQRISTVLDADKIIVLDRGQIESVGTHAELMARSPIYQEIYQSQLGDGKQNV